MSVTCTGCGRLFSHSGYSIHLALTRAPLCIAVREQQESLSNDVASGSGSSPIRHGLHNDPTRPSQGSPTSPSPSQSPPSSPAHSRLEAVFDNVDEGIEGWARQDGQDAAIFEGDYFGAYDPADFSDFDEEQAHVEEHPDTSDDEDVCDPGTDCDDASVIHIRADDPYPISQSVPYPSPVGPLNEAAAMQEDDSNGLGNLADAAPEREERQRAEAELRSRTHVVPYPDARAGAPIAFHSLPTLSGYKLYEQLVGTTDSAPYWPFASAMDWRIAHWAKTRGPGSTALTDLLEIEDLPERLGLSYRSSQELNALVDQLPTGRPRFVRREIEIGGETFEMFLRDILECIRALFGDPDFAGILVFRPERHYADEDYQTRVYFDVHTGEWWWATQEELDRERPGATIIPIIISSDKTQLTLFGSKMAYPVYMTIGNLPKDVRRKPSRQGQILLAYLPATSLSHITGTESRRRALANLFHACLTLALAPLKQAGIEGIELRTGDGAIHRGHPIFAMHVGDYPEQLLVTGCKRGECPKCPVPPDDAGDLSPQPRPLRDLEKVLVALGKIDESFTEFSRACRDAGIKPIVHPYWEDLPYVNIYRSITPDILHQLYQGVIKHVLSWLKEAYGPEEIDARCRRLPPNHNVRIFANGISRLQRVTGKEHEDICRVLLGLVVGLPLANGVSPARLLRAVRAILDFLYLAQYPAHTTTTLRLLRNALQRFHDHKSVFVDLGIRTHFKIPKIHALEHYIPSIRLFGTTDNYDTQYTERLHIDFAKEAYRATNRKDEFPQMTLWLERREKVLRHEAYIRWRLQQLHVQERGPRNAPSAAHPPVHATRPLADPLPVAEPAEPGPISASSRPVTSFVIARNPSVKALTFEAAVTRYAASFFRDALARFVVQYRQPDLSWRQIERASASVYFNFRSIPVFHKIKYLLDDVQGFGLVEPHRDVVHARPARQDSRGRPVPARFDTVLVNDGTGGLTGVTGYRVGQVRLVFKLPRKSHARLFPGLDPPEHLAYVEWFTAFTQPDPIHGMYKISRSIRARDGARLASVIEVRNIRRSCHLFPQFGTVVPRDWSSSNVLERCSTFWVSPFTDRHTFMIII
ncbi:hypothetical protein ACG7TL_007050 [Trametes sanguinea]